VPESSPHDLNEIATIDPGSGCLSVASVSNTISSNPELVSREPSLPKEWGPVLNRPDGVRYELGGVLQNYLGAIIQNCLLEMPERNPAILDMFCTRDETPYRSLLPWSGEFAGKYLTGAVQIYRLTGNAALKEYLARFLSKLIFLQDKTGYLGPFPPVNRLSPELPPIETRTHNGAAWKAPWDAWGHYHIMLALLLWHEETGDSRALRCAIRIGDLFCQKFLGTGTRIVDLGEAEMNQALIHSLCLLHRVTGTETYLQLARQIADEEFSDKNAGDYVRLAQAGKEFYEGPKPRWESLHPIQGLVELYWLTGEDKYREACEQIWWSIVKLDRHNNGGFSSGEKAQGNPYHQGAIETCCTVAWAVFSVDMLRLTGNSIVADELELSTLNQILGYEHESGKGCTYDTPMDGIRIDSTREIGFQIRPGSEEVNCCSANAPRGFGLIGEWALMADEAGLALNWYGPGLMTAQVKGVAVTLKQETDYPRGGRIKLHLSPEREVTFALKLRVPHWSSQTAVQVNGEAISSVPAGKYLVIDRTWLAGDTVLIDLDMSLHFWVGEKELEGRTSIYRGPLLLTREVPFCAPRLHDWQWNSMKEWATRQPGAVFEHDFSGTTVIWKGHLNADAGMASISIDGRDVGVVDQYDPNNIPFFWKYENLAPGKHTIKITLLPAKNSASSGHWINVKSIGCPETPEPVFDAARLDETLITQDGRALSQVKLEVNAIDRTKVFLRDYGTAGKEDTRYYSWHRVENILPASFSMANPLQSSRQRKFHRGNS
jgi:DUF1680 family protein